MDSSIDLPAQTWPVGQVMHTFDTPPPDSHGYSVSLCNRPNWPGGPCLRLLVEISFDNGLTWQAESENNFAGAVTGRGGAPIQAASVSGEWASVSVGGVMTVQRPTDIRVTTDILQSFVAPMSAGWV